MGAASNSLVKEYGFESTFFVMLCASAATVVSGWQFVATIPYSYMCAYSTTRAVMAFARKPAIKGSFIQFHRVFGSICVLYSCVAWYKLVFYRGGPVEWKVLDDILRTAAAASTLFNECTGILLFPKVTLDAPLLLRQVFTAATLDSLGTLLMVFIIQLRHWYPEGNRLTEVVSIFTVMLNSVGVLMGIRATIILSREKQLTPAELKEFERTAARKKRPPSNLVSYFYDVFLVPGQYDGTMCNSKGLQFIAYGSKRNAEVVTFSTITLPGILMGIMAFNLAFYKPMPILGAGELHNDYMVSYTLTVLEMAAFCVLPAK